MIYLSIKKRIDCTILISTSPSSFDNKNVVSVGIALKGSEGDIKNLRSIPKYFTNTNFFYVGVPSRLLKYASYTLKKMIEDHLILSNTVGLFNVETGEIIVFAEEQRIKDEDRLEFYSSLSSMESFQIIEVKL